MQDERTSAGQGCLVGLVVSSLFWSALVIGWRLLR